jgi:hypothetical protein
LATVEMPHLAIGGMPELPSADLGDSAFKDRGPNDGLGLLHPVNLHLPGGGSVDEVYARPSAVRELSDAANKAKRYSTGPKPSWYGGGGR